MKKRTFIIIAATALFLLNAGTKYPDTVGVQTPSGVTTVGYTLTDVHAWTFVESGTNGGAYSVKGEVLVTPDAAYTTEPFTFTVQVENGEILHLDGNVTEDVAKAILRDLVVDGGRFENDIVNQTVLASLK